MAAPSHDDLLLAVKAHLTARDALKGANVNSLTLTDPRFAAAADTLAALREAVAQAGAAQ